MAFGANIEHGTPSHIWENVVKKVGVRGVESMGPEGFLVMKDGAPATDTGADNPQKVGVICWDYTNDDVYVCTAWTNATTFDWTKVWD